MFRIRVDTGDQYELDFGECSGPDPLMCEAIEGLCRQVRSERGYHPDWDEPAARRVAELLHGEITYASPVLETDDPNVVY